jgi:hypothetical protein
MARNKAPLLVVVTESRYEMFGEPNPRTLWLSKLLKAQGGISDVVEPGTYEFNARRKGLFKIIVSLTRKD